MVEKKKPLPSIVPMKPLQFVSCNTTFNLVPLSIVESALTSPTAARMAGITELPITEFSVNKAPKFTTFGVDKEETVAFPVPPRTIIGNHIHETNKRNALLFTRASIATFQQAPLELAFRAALTQNLYLCYKYPLIKNQ